MARLLLIEDDNELVSMVAEWLSSEYVVDVAVDGQAGLDKLRDASYDLIVLDWRLPKISGIDLCKQFRSEGGKTPIIMLTGRSSVADREEGLDGGADDYLVKPFSMRELTSRLRALRRRGTLVSNQLLVSGDITLDVSKHRVTKGDIPVHLLPKEFALLEFLMRHPDEVFSSDNLLARVWSTDAETGANAVRTSIKRIRQKLDDEGCDDSRSIIENIPRVGYRLKSRS
ncbi:MAG: response regulator transcription factor [Cyanobacteria bacterium REEB67]|nr:response regulator transcription factor [Cyanobacteria bacterium REEB67]